jgi:hypothetical protein
MDNQANAMPMQPVGPDANGGWKKPWAAFNIIERPGLRGRIWSRVGTAWLNRDGSINLVLDSFPLTGKLNIREVDDKERSPRAEPRGTLSIAAETPDV